MDARYILFHAKPDTSELYFKVNVLELLPESKLFTNEEISLSVFIRWGNRDHRDSLNQEFQLPSINGRGEIMGKAKIPMKQGIWEVLVEISDIKSRKKDFIKILTEKTASANHSHDFLCIHSETKQPYFNNEIIHSDSILILHSAGAIQNLRVDYCAREFKLPPPPFSDSQTDMITSGDMHTIPSIHALNNALALKVKSGYYQIKNGEESGVGSCWWVNTSGINDFTEPLDLAESLRYITTKSEYDLIIKSPELKKAIDNYWLECAGSKDRARELISLYYGRVLHANRYFTSYTKGWRTDRGLIYIIYGPPKEVFEDEQYLRWYYEEQGEEGVIFNFKKSQIPQVGTIYLLERTAAHKTSWEARVQQWRQGKIYGKA